MPKLIMENIITYFVAVFLVLLISVGADQKAETENEAKTTSDIQAPATPKVVNLPKGIMHALEDFMLSAKIGQAMSIPPEELEAAMADSFQGILTYHMIGSDDAYNILKKVHDTPKEERQRGWPVIEF